MTVKDILSQISCDEARVKIWFADDSHTDIYVSDWADGYDHEYDDVKVTIEFEKGFDLVLIEDVK